MVSRIAKVINTMSKNLNAYLNIFLLTFLNARYSKKQIREYTNTNIGIMRLSLIIFVNYFLDLNNRMTKIENSITKVMITLNVSKLCFEKYVDPSVLVLISQYGSNGTPQRNR